MKVTESAKEKLLSIMAEDKTPVIRFGLRGGGCNGFEYYFSLDATKDEEDIVVPLDDSHSLLVDHMSMMYLTEAEIDYKRDIMGESFMFNNPQQKTNCGCGNSVGF